jgi:hypothetical protein
MRDNACPGSRSLGARLAAVAHMRSHEIPRTPAAIACVVALASAIGCSPADSDGGGTSSADATTHGDDGDDEGTLPTSSSPTSADEA